MHWGWILALILVVVSYIYFNKTKQGYEIAVVGESNNTARYAGINVGRVFRRTMFLSGALCGLVGMLQFAGSDFTITEGTAADLLIGIILFFMLGCEFFITYKLIGRGKEEHHA